MRNSGRYALTALTCLLLTGAAAANPTLTPGVWTAISPAGPSFTGSISGGSNAGQGMAIDPSNPSTIYFCVLQTGLYKTTDAGSTWDAVGKLEPDWTGYTKLCGSIRVRVDPHDSNHLYTGELIKNCLGFYISYTAGDSLIRPKGWKDFATAESIMIDDIYDIATDPNDFNHLLVTSHSPWKWNSPIYGQGSGVVESRDAGATWRVRPMQQSWGTGTNVWFCDNGATWILGTQADGFWRTADSGSTWTKVYAGSISHGGSQLYKAKNGVYYAACGDGVIRSTNKGVTWTKVGPMTFCGAVCGDGTYIYSKQAYNGGAGYFYRTPETDGVTWTAYTKGGSFTEGPFEMAFDSTNGILYAACWSNGFLAMKVENGTTVAHGLQVRMSAGQIGGRAMVVIGCRAAKGSIGSVYDVKGQRIDTGRVGRQAMVVGVK